MFQIMVTACDRHIYWLFIYQGVIFCLFPKGFHRITSWIQNLAIRGKANQKSSKGSGSHLAPSQLWLSLLGTALGCKFAGRFEEKGNSWPFSFNKRHRFIICRIILKVSLSRNCLLYSRQYFQVQFWKRQNTNQADGFQTDPPEM